MKQITLKFREVAVDGLPEESDCYVTIHRYPDKELQPDCWRYSAEHKLFNVYQDVNTALSVEYWMPLDEFNAAFKKETTHAAPVWMTKAAWLFCEYVTGGGFYFCSNCGEKMHGGAPVNKTCPGCKSYMLSNDEISELRKEYTTHAD